MSRPVVWTLLAASCLGPTAVPAEEAPLPQAWDYAGAMRAVARRGGGRPGVVLHVGDSITHANPYGQWARAGEGPTFLEFRTYRFLGHHTFEAATRPKYRDPEEITRWQARDPLVLQAGRVAEEVRTRIDAEVEETIEAAVRFALAGPKPDPSQGGDYLYASGLRARPGVAAIREERTARL